MRLTLAPLLVLLAATTVSAAPVSDISPARRDAAVAPEQLHDERSTSRRQLFNGVEEAEAMIVYLNNVIAKLHDIPIGLPPGSEAYNIIADHGKGLQRFRDDIVAALEAHRQAGLNVEPPHG